MVSRIESINAITGKKEIIMRNIQAGTKPSLDYVHDYISDDEEINPLLNSHVHVNVCEGEVNVEDYNGDYYV